VRGDSDGNVHPPDDSPLSSARLVSIGFFHSDPTERHLGRQLLRHMNEEANAASIAHGGPGNNQTFSASNGDELKRIVGEIAASEIALVN
jgi:hypothetical protein